MKGLILAAGYGTRLGELTIDTPKPLLLVDNKSILDHIVHKMSALPEIDTIYIVTNAHYFDQFSAWHARHHCPVPIEIINDGTRGNGTRLGALGDLRFVLEKKKISDDLLMIAGDNLFYFSLKEFLHFYNQKQRNPVVALHDLLDPQKLANRYGMAVVDKSCQVIRFEEKPANPTSSLASTACYLFPQGSLQELFTYCAEGNNSDNLGHFIIWLISRRKVYGFQFKESWFDIGTRDQLEEAQTSMVPISK